MRDLHTPDAQGFIPFIHNYCDRRCERCGFVRQCRVGFLEVDEVRGAGADVASERVEDRIERLRQLMMPPEDDGAEEPHGMDEGSFDTPDPSPEEEAAEAREREAKEKRVEAHELFRLTIGYMDLMQDWIAENEARMAAMGVQLHASSDLLVAANERTERSLVLSEAMDELLWFEHMLHVKVARALMGKIEYEVDGLFEGEDPLQSDHNGTAKLIMSILERCLGAWRTITEQWPESASSALPMQECLERCTVSMRAEFPDAEKFIRPGFDAP